MLSLWQGVVDQLWKHQDNPPFLSRPAKNKCDWVGRTTADSASFSGYDAMV